MIPFIIIRKILLLLVPLVIFYLLRKMSKDNPKIKSYLSDFDPSTGFPSTSLRAGRASKSQIIDGEIVEEKA